MLFYPLLQSEGSKRSSRTAYTHSLSVPCGMLVTWGSGTDLSAMLVATSCGLFWFTGGLEAQSLPSQRAQGNSWLLIYPNKGEQLELGTHIHDALEECAWKVPLAVCYGYRRAGYCRLLTLKEEENSPVNVVVS